ncbi:MAG: aquaporin [Bacteriovoracia bacterium]
MKITTSTFQMLLAEFLGTAGLLIVVVGSGIMGETLAGGNQAIALLANSLATGAGLYALIQTFGPVSGAHFNPAVSFVEFLWRRLTLRNLGLYSVAQVLGALAGVGLTHFIFGFPLFQLSRHDRGEVRLFTSEVIATLGLILVIALSGRKNVHATPMAVAFYITAAYWCTSSTSFANPAVTIARSFTDTFSGILWTGAPGFIAAQLFGATLAFNLTRVFSEK